MSPTRIPSLLERSALLHPKRPAVVLREGPLTYEALLSLAIRAAAGLRAAGLLPGQRVAFLSGPTQESLAGFFGALLAGLEPVDLPTHAGVRALMGMLAEAHPAALITEPTAWVAFAEAGELAGLPPVIFGPEALDGHLAEAGRRRASLFHEGPAESREHEIALVLYTSGTTGRPKGVMLSHHNLLSNLEASRSVYPLLDAERYLMLVPLHFVHGRTQLLGYLAAGATLYFSGGFRFPQEVLRELETHRITSTSGVPFHFTTLLERTRLAQTPLPDLRHLLITGGALTPARLRRLQGALPNVIIHTAYGATEASPRITHHGGAALRTRPESAGRPLPGVQVQILASDGEPVPQGGLGEVVVRGDSVMSGYVSGDQRELGVIDEHGRLHTGDLGWLDPSGELRLAGRKSDLIKTAGERVFPQEIEEVLLAHGAVEAAAVLGAPDPVLGERLVAMVVGRGKERPDLEALRAHCLKQLPFVRVPRELHVVTDLPKTPSGKVRRAALLPLLEAARRAAGGA
jgi:long-chain acyl-CoA synthetase